METVPSLADRLAALRSERTQANSAIEAANADAKTLTGRIGELKARLAVVEQQARDAELKMIEAERTGVKGSDSQASEAFRENYRKLSDQYRQALQEVATLKEGAIRNAKSTADEPECAAGSRESRQAHAAGTGNRRT
jgi:predicted  nucleic acid-binding Zn-ribbon protein